MPSIHETAYPRLKSALTLEELQEIYTPTLEEVWFCDRVVERIKSKLQFLILLNPALARAEPAPDLRALSLRPPFFFEFSRNLREFKKRCGEEEKRWEEILR